MLNIIDLNGNSFICLKYEQEFERNMTKIIAGNNEDAIDNIIFVWDYTFFVSQTGMKVKKVLKYKLSFGYFTLLIFEIKMFS